MILDCHVLGTIRTARLEQEAVNTLQQKLMVDVNVASQFPRAIVGGVRYYSQAYTRMTKRNSHTVCYKDSEATLRIWVDLPDQSVATLNKLSPTTAHCYLQGLVVLCSRIVPVKLEDSTDVIPINSLVSKCVYCSFSSTSKYIVVTRNCFTDD